MSNRTLTWCLRQKRGIRLVKPNQRLAKEYLRKAKSSLNMMNAAQQIGEVEWVVTTAYYARYFALYALLIKMGIRSEIHDCSIAVASPLAEHGVVQQEVVSDLSSAKELRIDMQYYIPRELKKENIEKSIEQARIFVLEMEKAIEAVDEERINLIRKILMGSEVRKR
jgi:uncharacterized protein (UPF0332 family)